MRTAVLLLVIFITMVLLWITVSVHSAPSIGSSMEADALRAQLAYLEPRMHKDLPMEMQRVFPEGSAFSYALYALSWSGLAARLPGDDDVCAHAAQEARWAYEQLDSKRSRAQFNAMIEPPFGVFYSGWRNEVLAAVVALEPSDTTLVRAFDRESTLIAEAFADSPTPFLESYPGQAWPADAVVALHSLCLHERIRGADHGAVIARWVQQAWAREDERGMIPHAWRPQLDLMRQTGRGSSMALMNVFLPEIDSALAFQQFSAWRGSCITETFGVPAVREHPIGIDAPGDVDSGPLILGYGPAATIVGVAACKRNGDAFHATEFARTLHGFGFATGGDERRYVFGALPIADLFIAWGRSMPGEELRVPPPGFLRFHAWCGLLVLLLWSPWLLRWWRAYRRKRRAVA